MKNLFFLLAIGIIIISGCLQINSGTNSTEHNITILNNTIPPGYEVKDYCKVDSDCVRAENCCDCGLGVYINKYNNPSTNCNGKPRCMCAITLSKGICKENKCTAITDQNNVSGFCGTSTKTACNTSLDCIVGGCSGQICSGKTDEQITTCEYRSCYNAQEFRLSCGCFEGKCQWG